MARRFSSTHGRSQEPTSLEESRHPDIVLLSHARRRFHFAIRATKFANKIHGSRGPAQQYFDPRKLLSSKPYFKFPGRTELGKAGSEATDVSCWTPSLRLLSGILSDYALPGDHYPKDQR